MKATIIFSMHSERASERERERERERVLYKIYNKECGNLFCF